MVSTKSVLATALLVATYTSAIKTRFTVKELKAISKHNAQLRGNAVVSAARDTNPALLYPAYNLSVPTDHFHNISEYEPHSNDSFNLRYWFDASNYKPGGPVIVLQGGETSGSDRLPFLQKGIVALLTQATNGIGVILEHRYYGTSFPVTNLSTESLRFLTTQQALADQAYFSQNVVFKGFEDVDLTSKSAAHIAYGGSYAGAFVALLRKIYPDVYWGAISSSGVTAAIYDYWAYYEAARIYSPSECVFNTQKVVNVVDNILLGDNTTEFIPRVKALYGLQNVTRNDDFAASLSGGISGLQGTNWDPSLNSTAFGKYCDTITAQNLVYPATAAKKDEALAILAASGYADEAGTLLTPLLNHIGYINASVVVGCAKSGDSQDDCLSSYNPEFYRQDSIHDTWRAWPYQFCREWGYLQTGSGTPPTQLSMISRLVDLPYSSIICREAFNITKPADTDRINKYGNFNFSYPRLAFIHGEHDPWRQASTQAIGLPVRESTTDEPVILIDRAVHHWDENGLFPNQTTADLPPKPVADAQSQEVAFVRAWWEEWKQNKSMNEVVDEL